jgi:4-hydroxy-3-methylbut-2-enyl diphosphate reductase
LEIYGAPVYVRHEIVHNKRVVDRLRDRGAIFVDELDLVPDDRPVVFSAHGVPKSVPLAAQTRELNWLDATCPLVSKVHIETERHYAAGRHVLLIGHAGHPEVIGTMGQVPEGAITLIETEADALAICPPEGELAYATQTTLSVADTADIVACLKQRFRDIHTPHKDDICYATTNRQTAVQDLAGEVEHMLVIGAPNSSNSQRLVEVARQAGCPHATLIGGAEDIPWAGLDGVEKIGVTAGASAPEELTREVIDAFDARFAITLVEMEGLEENVHFKLPRALRSASEKA